MINFTIKDKGKLIASLVSRTSKFKRDVRKNFKIEGDQFVQYIRGRWYNGRNSDDTGLNKQSGDLYRNWDTIVRDEGIDVVAMISNNMDYGWRHEIGDGVKKRTFVTSDIKSDEGKKFFLTAVEDAIKANF